MINPYEQITNFLKSNNVSYKETEHEPVYTSEQAARVRGISMGQAAKSLLLKSGDDFILAVLPGNRKLNTKKLRNLLKAKDLHFATPEEVKSIMGCEIGACYPFGNLIGVPVYVDIAVSKNSSIFTNPGVHNRTMEIRWRDVYSLVKPKLVDISEK